MPPSGAGRRAWARTAAKDWDAHVDHMETLARTPAFVALREAILERAALEGKERVLDVGAGTGLLALGAADRALSVIAVDISPAMCARLAARARAAGKANVEVREGDAAALPVADESVEVVISNYCFHHLPDPAKQRALAEVRRVLVPGGRFIFGDMMFSFSAASPRDRRVLRRLALRMARRGPAGILRLLRNGARLMLGRAEHPAPPQWWEGALVRAGFDAVSVKALEHEGGIACARKPPIVQEGGDQPQSVASAGQAGA
jgi:ubiquinone/menaquinone biosynthesis C-methylase UbiE